MSWQRCVLWVPEGDSHVVWKAPDHLSRLCPVLDEDKYVQVLSWALSHQWTLDAILHQVSTTQITRELALCENKRHSIKSKRYEKMWLKMINYFLATNSKKAFLVYYPLICIHADVTTVEITSIWLVDLKTTRTMQTTWKFQETWPS